MLPGTVETPASWAIFFEVILSPIISIAWAAGPIKINPLFNEEISFEEAEIGLNDVLNRKIARQYIDQELNEARENIFKNEEETLTWRIDQANKLLNKAISGINDNNHDERNRLNDDLNSINDLIKDKIWIKKNY